MDIVQQIESVDVNKDGLENFAREVNLKFLTKINFVNEFNFLFRNT